MSHATLPELIRTKLRSVPIIAEKIGQRIHYQHIPQESEYPHIWFSRRGSSTDDLMDGNGILRERFVIEVITPTFDDALITAIIGALEFDGIVLPTCTVATSDLDEVDDDYQFESGIGDTALSMHAFTLTLHVGD